MELQNLIGKNVSVGRRLFEHPDYVKSLKDKSLFERDKLLLYMNKLFIFIFIFIIIKYDLSLR
jgi:hypothetical protein